MAILYTWFSFKKAINFFWVSGLWDVIQTDSFNYEKEQLLEVSTGTNT